MADVKKDTRAVARDIVYAVNMAIASLVGYWAITQGLSQFVGRDDDLLGGMWTVIAIIFVFKQTRQESVAAGLSRLLATCVSFALCLAYLIWFPFTPFGMAVLLALGALIMMALGRRDDIITTGITTAVVMVVAGLSPQAAWREPLLRLLDTVVGVAVGVVFHGLASLLLARLAGPAPGAPATLRGRSAESDNLI
jgi:uncharacterized membrane protein YgaE (UPF0421/DUF939 family)